MRRFGFGYLPDKVGWYKPHHVLLAGDAELPLLPTSDLTELAGGPIVQRDVSLCVGCSFRWAGRVWNASRGIAAPDWSDLGAYTLGRLQERAGSDPETAGPLEDFGSMPELVLKSAQQVGIIMSIDWPGPGDAGFRRSLVDAIPSPDLLCAAFDRTGLDFFAVDRATDLRTQCDALMRRRIPVMVAICGNGLVDTDPGDSIVDRLPTTNHNHMVTIQSAADPDVALVRNWWDDPDDTGTWGIQSDEPRMRGCWKVRWSALSAGASHALAIRGATFKRGAA